MIKYNLMRYIEAPWHEFDEVLNSYDDINEAVKDEAFMRNVDNTGAIYYIEVCTADASEQEIRREAKRWFMPDYITKGMFGWDIDDVEAELHQIRDFEESEVY